MFNNFDIVVVGAGLFGSVVAEQASRQGYKVAVVEKRNHIGGNCYTEFDEETGINIHVYGPHIFHTSNEEIWNYVQQFSEFIPYHHIGRSSIGGKLYSLPINLETINKFFNTNFSPEEAEAFMETKRIHNDNPANFEEQALALVGQELYDAFIKGYTMKQWDRDPKELPASVARRLPVRTNYNANYYFDKWQAMPAEGFTPIFERMLDHENIKVFLDTDWNDVKQHITNQVVVYTGPIDAYYDYRFGVLNWRTLDFEFIREPVEEYYGCCQITFPEESVPWTRAVEHRYFHPERKLKAKKTIIGREYSRSAGMNDTPYYPVKTEQDMEMFNQYKDLADNEKRVIIGGRLGEYMYYDMHQVIGSALACYKNKITRMLKDD